MTDVLPRCIWLSIVPETGNLDNQMAEWDS